MLSNNNNLLSDILYQHYFSRREFDDMMMIKMKELEEQKEMAARRKLDAENTRIRYIVILVFSAYPIIYGYILFYFYSFTCLRAIL